MNVQNALQQIHNECLANVTLTQQAAKRFFKTSAGDYGENDVFLGIRVATLRKIAKNYQYSKLDVIEGLLKSQYNEKRLLALLILIDQYQKGDASCKEEKYQFYLKNLYYVNNWNLVDLSAHLIIGHHLMSRDRALLNKLAKSVVLWERRIAIVSTLFFIRRNDLITTFNIAKRLLNDNHDLIHKAVGWMLREAGKQNENQLLEFLTINAEYMPRTMLRYAAERLTPEQKSLFVRKADLSKQVA